MPRPDFPRTIVEFQQWFPDDEACAEYLFESRWPEGFRCPRCGHGDCWPVSKRRVLLECAGCHLQTSLTAGTVLHKTRTPLHLWFWAAYYCSRTSCCLLYTSDAADEEDSVDLGGRRII